MKMNMLFLIFIFIILINGCKGICVAGVNGCATCYSPSSNCVTCIASGNIYKYYNFV